MKASLAALGARWRALCQATGIGSAAGTLLEVLLEAYANPDRHYHNQDHVGFLLAGLDEHREMASNPVAVELAIWYHDVVLDPRSSHNEEDSAAYAWTCLTAAGLDPALAHQVRQLVLATRHTDPPRTPDEALLVDLDLAVLGSEEVAFDRFETAVRREYDWLDDTAFWRGRAALFERFLTREWLFHTARFRVCFEQPARRNLERSMARAARLVGAGGDEGSTSS